MNIGKRETWITGIFLGVMVLVFGALSWRVFDLKCNKRDYFVQNSRRQLSAFMEDLPRRGQILDRRGRVLAASVKRYTAFVDPSVLDDKPDRVLVTASMLQDALNIPGPEICQMIFDRYESRYIKIKTPLDENERNALSELNLRGVGVHDYDWDRLYPAGHLTGHLLGFVGTDNAGLSGLELRYNEILSGKRGRHYFVMSGGIRRLPISQQTNVGARVSDGMNLILTIDSVIQRFVYEALKEQLDAYEAESAIAVVMDPWTGAVLSMVSLPDFDPAEFSTTDQDLMRNRAMTDPFEPGSIFKPLVATMALDAKKIGYTEKFDCENGQWNKYGGIGEFGDHQYGMQDVREIIIHSSNIGMAKIGLKMGKKTLHEGLKLFGFGEVTGIDLNGEGAGLVRPLKKWDKYSLTRIPFGHEVLVTPLQICRAYSVLANGGCIVKPHIVRGIVDNKGQIISDRQPASHMGHIIDKEVAEWMVQTALSDVVNEGTGKKAQMENCQVWGKTGTANIAVNGAYDYRHYVASFVGGAPAKDPAVVVMVSIRNPNRSLNKGYSGGRVAAPVVGKILKNTLRYMGVVEEEPADDQMVANR